jgi:hypothetical protein
MDIQQAFEQEGWIGWQSDDRIYPLPRTTSKNVAGGAPDIPQGTQVRLVKEISEAEIEEWHRRTGRPRAFRRRYFYRAVAE